MRSRQAGVTFIGWILLLLPLAILVFAGIKLFPVYMNYMSVSKALNTVAESFQGQEGLSPQTIRSSLQARFDVDDVEHPTVQEIIVEREGQNWAIEADYEDAANLFAGISLLVHFDKRVVVR